MPNLTEHEQRAAERLLATLLPLAKERVVEGEGYKIERRSAIAKAQAPYMIEANLSGVHIFRANTGGWIADIYFENTPPWIGNVMGVPVGSPCKTREEAIDIAIHILVMVLQNKNSEPTNPVFALYDMVFDLPEDMMQHLAEVQPKIEGTLGYGSQDLAVARLESVLERYFGTAKASHAGFQTLLRECQIHILAVCCMCALSGLNRYPKPEPKILED